jgi:hypothetical protein
LCEGGGSEDVLEPFEKVVGKGRSEDRRLFLAAGLDKKMVGKQLRILPLE